MTQRTKRITLLLLASTLVAIILLSSSLSNLRLHTGGSFPGAENTGNDSQPVTQFAPVGTDFSPILKGIFDLVLLIFIISVAARLIMLVNMKRIFKLLLVIITLLVLANLISYLPGSQPVYLPGESSKATQPAFDYPVAPLGEPPQALLWIVLIGFVLGVWLLAMNILKQRSFPTKVEDQLSKEAEAAVNAIKLGEDLRNVIIRCYLQMTQALQEEQGIERSNTMTVREFEEGLTSKGFPTIPVRQLSRLFEKVRYSGQKSLKEDEKTAVESLNEILEFCRRRRN